MKKLTLVLISLALGLVSLSAQDFTRKQIAFREGIVEYLNDEGFKAKVDEDGDVAFKKEGKDYWISIESEDPFYIEFHVSGFSMEDVNRRAMINAANQANLTKRCGKACVGDESVAFTVEYYVQTLTSFKETFYRNLRALDAIKEATVDNYEE
jgi:hypothetical protein